MRSCSVPVSKASGVTVVRGRSSTATLQRKHAQCAHRFQKPWEALSTNLSSAASDPPDMPIQRPVRQHLRASENALRFGSPVSQWRSCHNLPCHSPKVGAAPCGVNDRGRRDSEGTQSHKQGRRTYVLGHRYLARIRRGLAK